MTGTHETQALEPAEPDRLRSEIRRYADAVDRFRREGKEPRRRLESPDTEVPSMTVSQQVDLATRRWHTILSRLPDAVLGALLLALFTAAWLTFFLYVPFVFTPPRP